jgi:hypothetical protein
MNSARVISVYMDNVDPRVVAYQRRCVERCLPDGWTFYQYHSNESHDCAISRCLDESKDDVIVVLDIDCIPLSPAALPLLKSHAEKGALAGAVQRANHINNEGHLYVGPFCMSFSRSVYDRLGKPPFCDTTRGDVGEELTYRWEESGLKAFFLWPNHVEYAKWPLIGESYFGYGTTYDSLFYHAFCIRDGVTSNLFLSRCERALNGE